MTCPVQSTPRAIATKPREGAGAASARKRTFVRRADDHSQAVRHSLQAVFLLLNVWIGVEFFFWVRHFETGGKWPAVARPPGVEGWLPIASLMNLKAWVLTGAIPQIHPAGMFLLVAFLAISLLLRKSFCSWLCPIGSVSELLWKTGHEAFQRNWKIPRRLDIPLRGLKYLLLGFFVYAVATMPIAGIRAFLDGPYGVVADVRMMNFFRFLSGTAAVVLGILVLLSVFIQNFWCRYLCPYGAMMGLVARFSPARIRRFEGPCIDCGKCARACGSLIPVDKLLSVRTPECTGCYECVAACPVAGALEMTVAKRRFPAWAMAVVMGAIFFGVTGYARWSGSWHTNIPDRVYTEIVPHAESFGHP